MKRILLSKPRASGKTAALKLYFHENHKKYDMVVALARNADATASLLDYIKQFTHKTTAILRGVCAQQVLVLIDEVYLVPNDQFIELQNNICILEDKGITVDVVAVGTPVTASVEQFFRKSHSCTSRFQN